MVTAPGALYLGEWRGSETCATRPALKDHLGVAEAEPGTDGSSGLSVAAVARLLGVAPGTLRTWDHRYGVGPSGHEPGQHRRYAAADVSRLQWMRRLLLQGVSAAEAARVVTTSASAAGTSPT